MLLKLLPVVPFLMVTCLVAVRFWNQTILAVMLWALVEGAVRKWLLPSYQGQILLLKDVVLLFAYIGYLLDRKLRPQLGERSSILYALVLLEGAYCLLELLNLNTPSTLLSIFGIKNYVIYIPLAFIIPSIIQSRGALRKLLLGSCLAGIFVALVGLYQFSQPPTSWVNQYVSHEEGVQAAVSLFGENGEGEFMYGRARTSSTFSYIGGFVTFLMLSVPLAASLLLSGAVKGRAALMVSISFLVLLGASTTTGSRTPVAVFTFAGPLLLMLASGKRLLSFITAIRLVIASVALAVSASWAFGDSISALEYRANNSDSAFVRMMSPLTETLDAFYNSPLIGTGIGTNSNAAITLMQGASPSWLGGHAYEVEPARVMQELGPVGFVLVYLPKLLVIFLVLNFIQRSQSRLMIAAHMSVLMFVLSHLFLFTVNNPTGGLLYWTAVGASIAAGRIERAERRRFNTYVRARPFASERILASV